MPIKGGCGRKDCASSSGIDGSITFGQGALDEWGYFEAPCSPCARAAESDPELSKMGQTFWPPADQATAPRWRVEILCGIPGSGKSTLARAMVRELDKKNEATKFAKKSHAIFSANSYMEVPGQGYVYDQNKLPFAHGECLKEFVRALQRETNLIVVDNTNLTVEEIAPYYALADAYGCEVRVTFLKCDFQTAKSRNIHNVPSQKLDMMEAKLRKLVKTFPARWLWREVVSEPETA